MATELILSELGAEAALALAGEAARATRGILEAGRLKPQAAVSQIGRDIKLREDAASEAVIRQVLSNGSSYPILGEEMQWGETVPGSGPYWVVDPLDGSFNFFRGVPLYAVSIALCTGQGAARRATLGAIFDPVRDELVSGGAGLGLRLNGAAVTPVPAQRQMLATGYPSRSDPAQVNARLMAASRDWRKIRMLGSAALSLAWVALGRLDGYEESSIMWWDVAAGLALAQAAGLGCVECVARDEFMVDVRVGPGRPDDDECKGDYHE
jgi:myo-inositol-1(or 4)-monophosphatase